MPVVSNTSPLLNLAIIDRLYLLRQQFGQIQIPAAVLTELRVEEPLPGAASLKEAIEAGWLRVENVTDLELVQLLRQNLDAGEAETIVLSRQLKADWTLLDEKEGRKIARSLGLKVTGILGILLRAWRAGELSSVREVTDELRLLANFRIAPTLLAQILQETGEA